MGLTPKEMKIAMDSGKVLINNYNRSKAFIEDGVYTVESARGIKSLMAQSWSAKWEIYEEPKPVFPFKCFDRVIVRNDRTHRWSPEFFRSKDTQEYPFNTICNHSYAFIAHYEGNEDFATNPDGVKGIWTREML